MGSTPRRLKNFPATKTSSSSSQNKTKPAARRHQQHHHKRPTTRTCSSVSDKLEALKNLIPAQEHYEIAAAAAAATTTSSSSSAADQLFQETADYILLLQTQVSVLQKLVDFYGSSSSSSSVQPHSN